MDLVATLSDPSKAQALVTWNINIAASNPDQARLHRVLREERLFHVAIDPFPTDTTDFADYVLPAASFLEFDDIVTSYFNLTISPQVKADEPPGQALPNQEIFRRLAAAMGYGEAELFESDAALLDAQPRPERLLGRALDPGADDTPAIDIVDDVAFLHARLALGARVHIRCHADPLPPA